MPRKDTGKAFQALEIEKVTKREEEQTKHLLKNENSPEYLKKAELIDAIRQAPNKAAGKEAIADAAKAHVGDNVSRCQFRISEAVIRVSLLQKALCYPCFVGTGRMQKMSCAFYSYGKAAEGLLDNISI